MRTFGFLGWTAAGTRVDSRPAMKRIPWSETLLLVAVVSVLANVAFCEKHARMVKLARDLSLQGEALQQATLSAGQERSLVQRLSLAALQHGRQDPAILDRLAPFIPMFSELGINVTANAAPARNR